MSRPKHIQDGTPEHEEWKRKEAQRIRDRRANEKKESDNMPEPKLTTLAIQQLRTDGGTQQRVEWKPEVVRDYADLLKANVTLPPLVVFYDKKYFWLADGYYRRAAYAECDIVEVPVHLHQGTQRDAILYSVGANATHGLRRTNADKRRAVMTLLTDAEWSKRSDRWIAEQCGVSHEFVRLVRNSLSTVDSENGAQVSTVDTSTANNVSSRVGRDGKSYSSTGSRNSETEEPDDDRYFTEGEDPGDEIITGGTEPERDPNGVYVETKTETINADLPEEPKGFDIDDLTQEEQDALSDDDWLAYLPLRAKLTFESIDTRLFCDAALNWRKLRKSHQSLKREVKATVNANAPDAYSVHMRTAVAMQHPKDWKFSRAAAGGFLLW